MCYANPKREHFNKHIHASWRELISTTKIIIHTCLPLTAHAACNAQHPWTQHFNQVSLDHTQPTFPGCWIINNGKKLLQASQPQQHLSFVNLIHNSVQLHFKSITSCWQITQCCWCCCRHQLHPLLCTCGPGAFCIFDWNSCNVKYFLKSFLLIH